jgi:hypothetical protein
MQILIRGAFFCVLGRFWRRLQKTFKNPSRRLRGQALGVPGGVLRLQEHELQQARAPGREERSRRSSAAVAGRLAADAADAQKSKTAKTRNCKKRRKKGRKTKNDEKLYFSVFRFFEMFPNRVLKQNHYQIMIPRRFLGIIKRVFM